MGVNGVSEKDWKLYKSRIADWQEKYMERLCKEYIELLSAGVLASDRFWSLHDRINKDKKKKGVVVQNSRSEMKFNILSLLREGAIGMSDLNGFSDELVQTMERLTSLSDE